MKQQINKIYIENNNLNIDYGDGPTIYYWMKDNGSNPCACKATTTKSEYTTKAECEKAECKGTIYWNQYHTGDTGNKCVCKASTVKSDNFFTTKAECEKAECKGPAPVPNIRGYIGNGEGNTQAILENFSFVQNGGTYVIPDIYNEIILAFVTKYPLNDSNTIEFKINLTGLSQNSYNSLDKLITDLTTWKNKPDIYKRPKKILFSLGGATEIWDIFTTLVTNNNTTAYINALKYIKYSVNYQDDQKLPSIIGKDKLIDGFDIDYESGGFPGDQLYKMCQYMYKVVNDTKDLYYWSSAPEPVMADNNSIYAYNNSGLMKLLDLTTFQCYNNTPGGYNADEKGFLAKYNISSYGSGGDNCCSDKYKADRLCQNSGWFSPPADADADGVWKPMNASDGYVNGYYGGGWQIEYPPSSIDKSCFVCPDLSTEAFPETKQYWQLMYESLMCSNNCNKGDSYTIATSDKNINCCTSTDSSCLKLGILLPLSPIAGTAGDPVFNSTLRYDYFDFLQKLSNYKNLTTIGGWCIEQDIWYDNFLKGNTIQPTASWENWTNSDRYGPNIENINKGHWSKETSSGQPILSFTAAVHKFYDK